MVFENAYTLHRFDFSRYQPLYIDYKLWELLGVVITSFSLEINW